MPTRSPMASAASSRIVATFTGEGRVRLGGGDDHGLVVAHQFAVSRLRDQELRAAFLARVALAEEVSHYFCSAITGARTSPQQATVPSGAFTTMTSVPHFGHRCLVPT